MQALHGLPRKKNEKLATLLGAITVFIAVAVLVGWYLDAPLLKSVLPGFIAMKVNTAIGLLLFGVSTVLLSQKSTSESGAFGRKTIGLVLAGIGGVIGLATLSEYAFGWNLGIDELFFIDHGGIGKLYPPGRLAPITGFTFVDLAVGIFLNHLGSKPRYRGAQLAYFIVILISFQAIVSYALGIQFSFGLAAHTRIALHTAFAFILLGTAFLALSLEEGFMRIFMADTASGSSARRLIGASVIVPPAMYSLELAGIRLGFFEADFGTLLRVVGSVFFFVLMVWRNTERVHLSELSREATMQAMREQEIERNRLFAESQISVATHKSEARLRAIFDSAFDGIVGIDHEGAITDWNPQAEEIFGWNRNEVIGKKMVDIIIPEPYRADHLRGFAHYLASGEHAIINRSIEVEALRRNGEVFPIQLAVTLFHVGDKPSFSAFIADISVRKRNELELITTRQQALDAAKVKAEFLANMSHEIRTPMNGIIGMADLLLDTPLNDTQGRYAKIIQDSGTLLLTIINDILDFSKIEAGKLDLETVEFELTELVESQMELLLQKAREKNLTLNTYIDPKIPLLVKGDPGRIGQILLNLAGNAVKFTAEGSVTVRATHGNDGMIHFSVSDTGIGISEEAAQRLFQPFSQADGSTARRYGGTGLGLSISKRLVEMMAGEIRLKSQLGKGSEFTFTCPLIPVEQKGSLSRLPIGACRVLVVDDDVVSREIIEAYCAGWGFTVVSCHDEASALSAVRRSEHDGNRFSVGLIDKCLGPNKNGFGLAEKIRAELDSARLPLILFTAFDRDYQREDALRAGFVDYLTKPIRRNLLMAAILRQVRDPSADDAKFTRAVHETAVVAEEPTPRRYGKILIAEDNATNQMVAMAMLKKLGYACQAVANGREVLEVLGQGDFDLILMDCQMPEMDGFEATRKIRSAEKGSSRHIPILALTANAMKEDAARCLECGMDGHLPKPIRREKLASAIEAFLSEKNRRAS